MKKLAYFLVCIVLACTFLCGCGAERKTVVLTPQEEFAGKTLSEFMTSEKDAGRLDFTIENSMVTSVNGVKNTTNTFWMLYTDDADNSNSAWGTIEYDGKTYASATLGATELIIAKDCTYIWVYTKF